MRRLESVLALGLALLVVASTPVVGEPIAAAKWVPADADALLVLSKPPGGDVYPRLRDEILFATRLNEALGLETAYALGVDRILLASVRRDGDRRGFLAVLNGGFDMTKAERALAPGGDTRTRGKHRIRIASWQESGQAQALVKVDAETLLYGDLDIVERCLEPVPDSSHSIRARLEAASRESDGDAEIRVLLLPRWFGFEDPGTSPSLPIPSVTRSLASIEWSVVTGRVAKAEVAFETRTRARTVEDASILADALRGQLAQFRMNHGGPASVLRGLDEARVATRENVVTLSLGLSAEALTRIKQSQAARRLISWRFGVDERESRERVGEVLRLLAITKGSRVADLGSGAGFYTVALARTVGENGKVFAVEINETAVAEVKRRATEAPFPQVDAILATQDDAKLAGTSLDAVLIVNTYHEITHPAATLEHLYRALKPGGRVILIEPFSADRRNDPRESQVGKHQIAPEIVEAEVRRAGFEILRREDAFAAHEHHDGSVVQGLILARRP